MACPSPLPSDPAHHTVLPSTGRGMMICPLPNNRLPCPVTGGPITQWPRVRSASTTLSEIPSSKATPPVVSEPETVEGGVMQNLGASRASWGFMPNSSMLRRTWNGNGEWGSAIYIVDPGFRRSQDYNSMVAI